MSGAGWLEREAVLAVCGYSGSGKTTVLEAVIPRLVAGGLSVGVVKHDAHGFQVDRPGKDSDRLFRAGAEVVLRGPEEVASRSRPGPHTSLEGVVAHLLSRHDLVLVEGHRETPLPKVWLERPGGGGPPPGTEAVLRVLGWGEGRREALEEMVRRRVRGAWAQRRVLAGVLVGGRSRRMGRPKQLLELGGRAFARRIVEALEPLVDRVVALGAGTLPPELGDLPRVPDPPGLEGPLAGLAAALRWAPRCAWLVAACDLPFLGPDAVEWLLAHRTPGVRAVIPMTSGERAEPLLAVYEPHARVLVEDLVSRGLHAPRHLACASGVATPRVPPGLEPAWRNVNSPGDLASLPGD